MLTRCVRTPTTLDQVLPQTRQRKPSATGSKRSTGGEGLGVNSAGCAAGGWTDADAKVVVGAALSGAGGSIVVQGVSGLRRTDGCKDAQRATEA